MGRYRFNIFDRHKLYEEVWTYPVIKVAVFYGISDVALAKRCHQLNVPTPVRGYWNRIRAGQIIPRPPLPPSDGPDTITVRSFVSDEPLHKERPSVSVEIYGSIVIPENISVPSVLENPHPLVKQTLDILLKTRTSIFGVVFRRTGALDARVAPPSIDRAMRIFDTLIKEVERLGFRITVAGQGKGETHIDAIGAKVQIGLQEVVRSTRNPANPDRTGRKGWGRYDKEGFWDFHPTGSLRLVIKDGHRPQNLLRNFGDCKRFRLEDRLAHFLRAVLETAAHKVILMRQGSIGNRT